MLYRLSQLMLRSLTVSGGMGRKNFDVRSFIVFCLQFPFRLNEVQPKLFCLS